MKFLKRNWIILLITAVALILFRYIFNYNEWGIEWKPNPLIEFSKIVVGLTVATALLDQFIEVFFSEKEKDKEDKANAQAALKIGKFLYLNRLTELANAERDFLVNPASSSETKIEGLKADISNYKNILEGHETQISNLDNIRSGEIRRVAFVVSLILSLSGIHVLTQFINMENMKYWNYWLLVSSDIILTACLLSGGTTGINQFFTMIKSQIKNNIKR